MTDVTDITGRLLTDIRDEIRGTNARLDQTNTRLDQTVSRLDQTVNRLDQTVSGLDQAVARLDAHDRILIRIADTLGSMDGRLERVERGQSRLEAAQAGTNERLSTLVGLIGRAVERDDELDEQGKRIDAALEELRRKVEQLERRPGG
jgi:chromosome segregation ATPase